MIRFCTGFCKELWDEFRTQVIIGFVLAVIAAPLGYMWADTEFPYTYYAEGSFIEPPQGSPEQLFTVNWRVDVNRECHGYTQRVIFDPSSGVRIYTYDATPMVGNGNIINEINGKKGPFLSRTFSIPQNSQYRGRAGYRVIACAQCNPLRQLYPVCISTPDLFFEITDVKT